MSPIVTTYLWFHPLDGSQCTEEVILSLVECIAVTISLKVRLLPYLKRPLVTCVCDSHTKYLPPRWSFPIVSVCVDQPLYPIILHHRKACFYDHWGGLSPQLIFLDEVIVLVHGLLRWMLPLERVKTMAMWCLCLFLCLYVCVSNKFFVQLK